MKIETLEGFYKSIAVKTTYYLITASGSVVRATTKKAQEKLSRLANIQPGILRPIPPKEAKQLIAAGAVYEKLKDVI